jgi:hypothetical protein
MGAVTAATSSGPSVVQEVDVSFVDNLESASGPFARLLALAAWLFSSVSGFVLREAASCCLCVRCASTAAECCRPFHRRDLLPFGTLKRLGPPLY